MDHISSSTNGSSCALSYFSLCLSYFIPPMSMSSSRMSSIDYWDLPLAFGILRDELLTHKYLEWIFILGNYGLICFWGFNNFYCLTGLTFWDNWNLLLGFGVSPSGDMGGVGFSCLLGFSPCIIGITLVWVWTDINLKYAIMNLVMHQVLHFLVLRHCNWNCLSVPAEEYSLWQYYNCEDFLHIFDMKGKKKIRMLNHHYAKMSTKEKRRKTQAIILVRKRKQFSNLEIACLPSSSHSLTSTSCFPPHFRLLELRPSLPLHVHSNCSSLLLHLTSDIYTQRQPHHVKHNPFIPTCSKIVEEMMKALIYFLPGNFLISAIVLPHLVADGASVKYCDKKVDYVAKVSGVDIIDPYPVA
ncbi:hypothetical protein MA16_Dca001827 [Dendrobium catenatum]|uniref:Uncharacterized protein n=1 Tax=Dendrobium catenatum TaxID=906689 RepID=A0A2I0XDK9_9ASPA|nr:hypothetical protein MA16_Dca001827 [Dendrobium catenatum]